MTLSNNQIKLINSLHSKKGRIDNNLFLVEGEKGIRELLDSSFKIEFIVLNHKEIQSDLNFGNIPDIQSRLKDYRVVVLRNLSQYNKFSIQLSKG
jgi:TrmH family RNA methyltransferase